MVTHFIQSGSLSYKDLLNQRSDERFLRITQRLAVELNILHARDLGQLQGDLPSRLNNSTALASQDDFIAQSIKKILDIRKRLGIESPAGQNSPLDDLLKPSLKGSLLDKTS
ncbi:MAG: hypothetical protein H6858_01545 [Rhodospirillales bacterium]|nr:hypothetical protein [Alphaproteobacteria bacterium]MCB9976266.1 hypothetical protein [Rhodospirillales bacterium]